MKNQSKGGWCDLHDDDDDVVELRTCAHDAVYNSALCIGVQLDHDHILKCVPPCRTVNTDIKENFQMHQGRTFLSGNKHDKERRK